MRTASIVLLIFLANSADAQAPKSLLIEATAGRFVGLPIHWGSQDAALLEKSGRIQIFEQNEIRQHQLLDEPFQPVTLQEARARLQSELGANYETLMTGPYVIAAPKGEAARWENRFRTLYSGYVRYFETRGWQLRKPDFPLVVIVLPNRDEFARVASRETDGATLGNNLAGMYVPRTNRCLLFNMPAGNATNWQATEATIVHEAVHQLAYNSGLHERLFEHPLWMVEGLATMFEVPAVYDTNAARAGIENRFYASRASEVLQLVSNDPNELGDLFQELVADDHLFRSNPNEAYALAWAMTFYLSERMPKQYFQYMALQRQRGFEAYSAENRQLDFRQAFQSSPKQLAPQVLRILKP